MSTLGVLAALAVPESSVARSRWQGGGSWGNRGFLRAQVRIDTDGGSAPTIAKV
jgi:hypothetical protein